MHLKEYLRMADVIAVETKEATCGHYGRRDIQPFIVAFRGEEPVAQVLLRRHVRDEILAVAGCMAAGFGADVISVTHEGFAATEVIEPGQEGRGINPMTGRRWDTGEMQDAAENHQGIEKGWISECLNVMVVNRAGDVGLGVRKFGYVTTAFGSQRLSWRDEDPGDTWLQTTAEGARARGTMVAYLARIMLDPTIAQQAERMIPGILERFTIDQRDVVIAEYLHQVADCQVVLYCTSDDQARRDAFQGRGVELKIRESE